MADQSRHKSLDVLCSMCRTPSVLTITPARDVTECACLHVLDIRGYEQRSLRATMMILRSTRIGLVIGA
jgi:hypothetical protein